MKWKFYHFMNPWTLNVITMVTFKCRMFLCAVYNNGLAPNTPFRAPSNTFISILKCLYNTPCSFKYFNVICTSSSGGVFIMLHFELAFFLPIWKNITDPKSSIKTPKAKILCNFLYFTTVFKLTSVKVIEFVMFYELK